MHAGHDLAPVELYMSVVLPAFERALLYTTKKLFPRFSEPARNSTVLACC